jgi:site-specific DNA-methyltransferase (adenine-specific)
MTKITIDKNMKSKVKLMLGDNMKSLDLLPDNSIDSIVSDPPYGLSFMGKKWDYDVPSVDFWKEVYRVLKPGGHVLSFGGTRTYHRMVVNIEDAGFEIRDQIMWLYASGFPKSHNISKAIDKVEGNERKVIGKKIQRVDGTLRNSQPNGGFMKENVITKKSDGYIDVEEPGSDNSKKYEGWGTALKPANEPICVARKPLSEKSVAENVLKWGTGGINIDGCRIGTEVRNNGSSLRDIRKGSIDAQISSTRERIQREDSIVEGRFPANIILDEIAGELLDEQSGYLKSGEVKPHHKKNKTANGYQGSCYGKFQNEDTTLKGYGDGGGASRFFYQAKVSKAERNMGLDEFEETTTGGKGHGLDRRCSHCNTSMLKPEDCKCEEPDWITPPKKNTHPTVKPVALMAYLVRLVTPPNGIVLDPFMGSGSTGISAQLEGFRFVGMEQDKSYFDIASARIENFEEYRKFIKK